MEILPTVETKNATETIGSNGYIYMEFIADITNAEASRMMEKLNRDSYTKIIHTTYIETKRQLIFVLEKTQTTWIKIVGKKELVNDAVDHQYKYITPQNWVYGNIKTHFDLVGPFDLSNLNKGQLYAILNLSYISIITMSQKSITIAYNYENNISRLMRILP